MFVIGICGPSGSGKSTISRTLSRQLGATVLSLDNYFVLPPAYKKYGEQGKDLELPQNTDWKKVCQVISDLQTTGKATGQKVNWKTNKNEERMIRAKEFLIVEGFLTFHSLPLLKKFDLAIYLDISDEQGIARRLKREKSQENKVWFETVTFPEYKKRRKKFEERADVVLDAQLPVQELVNAILLEVKRKKP